MMYEQNYYENQRQVHCMMCEQNFYENQRHRGGLVPTSLICRLIILLDLVFTKIAQIASKSKLFKKISNKPSLLKESAQDIYINMELLFDQNSNGK